MKESVHCPCGSNKKFNECCAVFISESKMPETAEQLMRSRYSAFVTQDFEYLRNSTDPQVALEINHDANQKWAESVDFLRLEILSSQEEANKATIEFKAYFREKIDPSRKEQIHHEVSKFRKNKGVWYFRDGRTRDE